MSSRLEGIDEEEGNLRRDPHDDLGQARLEAERESLKSGSEKQRLVNRNLKWSLWLRVCAIALAVLVVVLFGVMLCFVICRLLALEVDEWKALSGASAVIVSMIVAPTLSITAMVAAVVVGVFRKASEEGDPNTPASHHPTADMLRSFLSNSGGSS